MRECVARRAAKEPVQYILGEWDFYNLRSIKVRPPTVSVCVLCVHVYALARAREGMRVVLV